MRSDIAEDKSTLDDPLPPLARDDFDRYVEGWADIKTRALECQKCLSKDGPWPDKERTARSMEGQERPCIHEDMLTQYVNKVINQAEASPIGIEVGPDGDGATPESAEFEENRIRQIDYESNATHARLSALESAVQQGVGVWEVGTDWEKPPSGDLKKITDLKSLFRQKITTIAAQDPWSYVLDPDAVKPDWSDMKGAFKLRWFTHEEFRQKFPNAKIQDFKGLITPDNARWMDDHRVQVAEWWRVEPTYRKALQIENPDGSTTEVWEDTLSEEEVSKSNVISRRDVEKCTVMKRLTNGVEILNEVEWPDYEIPILVTTGRVKYENGVRVIDSLIHAAIPGQLMYDYTISGIVEETNRVIKTKAWGYEGAFDTSTNWATINREATGYAEEKAVYDKNGLLLPRAQLIQSNPQIQALLEQKQSILIGIQNAIGMTSTERVDRASKSGIAQQEIKEDMNVNTYHFTNSWKMATEREGKIKERLLAKIEPKEGKASLRNPKGDHEMAAIPPNVYDGRHTVVISAGEPYKSAQEKQKSTLEMLMKSPDPSIHVAAAPDLVRMLIPGPMGESLATSLESIQPPEMQQARQQASGKGPDPQQQLTQLQQQLGMLTEHVKEMAATNKQQAQIIDAKVIENSAKKDIELGKAGFQKDIALAKLELEKYKIDMSREVALIGAKTEAASTAAVIESEHILTAEQHNFETDMSVLEHHQSTAQADQAHQQNTDLTTMQQDHEAGQGDIARAHEADMAAQQQPEAGA